MIRSTPAFAPTNLNQRVKTSSLVHYFARRQFLLFMVAAACITVFTCWLPIWDAGDAHEYIHTQQSLWAHGSPDLQTQDIVQTFAHLKVYDFNTRLDPFLGYYQAHNGEWYCWHFWLYPLLTLPARGLLHAVNANESLSFFWTNLICVLGACYVALFHSGFAPVKRWLLVGFSVVSPVVWSICWIHTEAMTWSCVLMAVAFLSKRRYTLGAVCAGLGALQNPPLIALALYGFGLAWHDASCTKTKHSKEVSQASFWSRWHGVVGAASGVVLCLVPALFYQTLFGTSNLIVREGGSSLHFISWTRFTGLLFDLNQGMLPYVPVLVVLGITAFAFALQRRQWRAVGLGLVLLLMMGGACTTNNWNSGCAGMLRYAIWLLPLFAWLVVEVLPNTFKVRAVMVAGIALQTCLVLSSNASDDALQVRGPARVVWNYAPALYNPDFEIFKQRVAAHSRVLPEELPLGFIAPSGHVTKILTNAAGLGQFQRHFYGVSPEWLHKVQGENKDRQGWFYLQPPPDAIQGTLDPFAGKPAELPFS